MLDWTSDELTDFQILLADYYEVFRADTRKRNPSDSDYAHWLGVKAGTFSTWVNEKREPELMNVIILKKRMGWKVFDILGIDRKLFYATDDPKLRIINENYDAIVSKREGSELIDKIILFIKESITGEGK